MATFRKRRIRPSPNKNQAKTLRRQGDQELPQLGTLYPSVERLHVGLRFVNPQGHPVGEKDMFLEPQDEADFLVPCSGLCGDGRMDLEGKINEVVLNRETVSESRGKCARVIYQDTGEICGHELHCRIEVTYRD